MAKNRNCYLVNVEEDFLKTIDDNIAFTKEENEATRFTYKEAMDFKNKHKEVELHIKEFKN